MKLPLAEFRKKNLLENFRKNNNFGLSIEIAIGDFPKKNNENSQGNKIKNKKGIFNNSG